MGNFTPLNKLNRTSLLVPLITTGLILSVPPLEAEVVYGFNRARISSAAPTAQTITTAPMSADATIKEGESAKQDPSLTPVKSFRFVAFGDYQGGNEKILMNLKAQTGKPTPSFYLNTGDIQKWPTNKTFANGFPYGKLYPARGNNDGTEFWKSINPCPKSKLNRCSFSYLNSHFVILDSSDKIPLRSEKPNCLKPSNQTDWLDCDLKKASKDTSIKNIFVVLHEPPLTYGGPGAHPGNSTELSVFEPIFKENAKIKAVLSGHNHFYQRLKQNGINYFVIGGAGAPLYPLTDKPPSSVQKQAKKYHYAIFDVSGSKVTVKVIGYDDKTDKFAPIESAEL
jgi:hypothetical protein